MIAALIDAGAVVLAVVLTFAICNALDKIETAERDAEDKIRRDGACPASRRRGSQQQQPKRKQRPREAARVFRGVDASALGGDDSRQERFRNLASAPRVRGDGASSGMFCAPTPRVPDEMP